MKVAIHQPNFAPWLGFLHKLASVDVFVLFDDVMTPRGKSFVNRVKIKHQNADSWLTVPVTGRGNQPLIRDLQICADQTWRRKLLRKIEVSYRKTAHFATHFEELSTILDQEHAKIFELNKALINWIKSKLELETHLVESSAVLNAQELSGKEKILAILKSLNATEYLSGSGEGSRRYICETDFQRHHIALSWQEFSHPIYPQIGDTFIPNLSFLDALFCIGKDRLRELIIPAAPPPNHPAQ